MTLKTVTPEFLAAIAGALGQTAISDPKPDHLTEPRGRFKGRAEHLILPRSTEDVAAVVRLAAQHRIGLIPYGGGTGLVGAQVQGSEGPAAVLVSLERMNRIREVAPLDNVIEVEAGAILAEVQQAAANAGRLFPLSLASEGSARIGGCLSTNAGGVQVLRYGNARDLCLGIEAVLPDGQIMHGLQRLRKDNTGYDLRHLLIGAEGTLGIITAASLRLFPAPQNVTTVLAGISDPAAAVALLHTVQQALGDVTAFELIAHTGLDFLAEKLPHVATPFRQTPDWSLLIEAHGVEAEERLTTILADRLGEDQEIYVAQNQAQAQSFWTIRETIPEGNRLVGAVSSHDISVPISTIPDYIARAKDTVAAINPDLRINCFGHIGDGNLHFNAFPPRGGDKSDYADIRQQVTRAVHDLVDEMGGSISAEHGIGRLKREDLGRYGDPARLSAMRTIKRALDPHGIMNPGALLKP